MVAAFYLVVLVVLWMTREPGIAPGWGAFFVDGFVPDASPAVVIAFLAILTPAALAHIASSSTTTTSGDKEKVKEKEGERERKQSRRSELFIDWREIEREIPWSLFFMIGGAFAISDGASVRVSTSTSSSTLISLVLVSDLSIFSSLMRTGTWPCRRQA